MIVNINNKFMLVKRLMVFYINLSDYSIVIIIILAINNVLFIKIKVNTFLVKVTYRIV